MNIDINEIKKFDNPSANWWDLEGEFKPLHQINPLRLRFIQQNVNLAGKEVIDVGCGGGILTEALAISGAHVTGIDMSESALIQARQHAQLNQLAIQYHQDTVEAFAAQQANQFDVVTCMELLEHVPDPHSIVQACSQLVKQDGLVFFGTINRNIKSFAHAIFGAEYILKLLPKGTHHYEKFIKPSELAQWSKNQGLNVKQIVGMNYNLFKRHYYLTDDVSVNYLNSNKKC